MNKRKNIRQRHENVFYVYAYCDPRKPGIWKTDVFTFFFEPFYIGEGKNSRITDHLKDESACYKVRKIKKILAVNMTPIMLKLSDNLSGDRGLELERFLIMQLGTHNVISGVRRGPLTNLKIECVNGKKQILSDETRLKIGLKTGNPSAETSLKLSKVNKNRKRSEESRQRMHVAQQQRSEETCGKLSASHLKRSEETKNRMDVAKRKNWLIHFEDGRHPIYTDNLQVWCKEHRISYNSLQGTRKIPNKIKFRNGLFLELLEKNIVTLTLHRD